MRIAIFSDVHGNRHALQAVLDDIDAQAPFDDIFHAGDLVFGAAYPFECLEMVRERDIPGVYGNMDLFLWQPPDEPPPRSDQAESSHWQGFLDCRDWHLARIGDDGLAYLKTMPFSRTCSTGDLLIFHANPHDTTGVLFPPEEVQRRIMGEIEQTDAQALALLESVTAPTVAFGHIHIPNVRRVGDFTLVNVASVSRPFDGDWRAKYAILEHEDDGTWTVEHRRLEYDIEAARRAIREAGMPLADKWTADLLVE